MNQELMRQLRRMAQTGLASEGVGVAVAGDKLNQLLDEVERLSAEVGALRAECAAKDSIVGAALGIRRADDLPLPTQELQDQNDQLNGLIEWLTGRLNTAKHLLMRVEDAFLCQEWDRALSREIQSFLNEELEIEDVSNEGR